MSETTKARCDVCGYSLLDHTIPCARITTVTADLNPKLVPGAQRITAEPIKVTPALSRLSWAALRPGAGLNTDNDFCVVGKTRDGNDIRLSDDHAFAAVALLRPAVRFHARGCERAPGCGRATRRNDDSDVLGASYGVDAHRCGTTLPLLPPQERHERNTD